MKQVQNYAAEICIRQMKIATFKTFLRAEHAIGNHPSSDDQPFRSSNSVVGAHPVLASIEQYLRA